MGCAASRRVPVPLAHERLQASRCRALRRLRYTRYCERPVRWAVRRVHRERLVPEVISASDTRVLALGDPGADERRLSSADAATPYGAVGQILAVSRIAVANRRAPLCWQGEPAVPLALRRFPQPPVLCAALRR